MGRLYDRIGGGYAARRKADPRISVRIASLLQGMASVINVGAGTGAYEPTDSFLVAVEPSEQMLSQRRSRALSVRANAEALPFPGNSFDASMAILTIHHWRDWRRGLAECLRVARRRLVILTWDPESDGFWLEQEYFRELLAVDRRVFPRMDELRAALGPTSIATLPIPADCRDGFLGAYWQRPDAYLDADVRSAISSFARIGDLEPGLAALRRDLASGAWTRRHRLLQSIDELDVGYRLVWTVDAGSAVA
jgi:SAM-dependent methyltransferase